MRPLIASVSVLGLIHIWVTGITENWSAYAPGFEELDENVEYQEKEDEFDIVRVSSFFRSFSHVVCLPSTSRFQEDESVIKRRKADEQDRRVDINTINHIRSFTPPIEIDDAFEEFITFEPDFDNDERFYPAPELDVWYEGEEEVPDQILGPHAAAPMMQAPAVTFLGYEDGGNFSEDMYLPEEGRYVPKKKTRGRKRREDT